MQKLSFATYSTEGDITDIWTPESSGDWATDTAKGKAYAAEAVRHMFFHDMTPVLGFIIKAMIGRGQFGGVEAGFCQGIADNAVSVG